MGLRAFSIGSFVADSLSIATLAMNGFGTETMLPAVLLVGATVLPTACCLAGVLVRLTDRPTAEVARQLAGFDVNFR